MRMPSRPSVPLLLVGLLAVVLALSCWRHRAGGGTRWRTGPPPMQGPVRLRFQILTQGEAAQQPLYATFTGLDAHGQFCRMDPGGRFLPCTPADNVNLRDGQTWCDYGIPVRPEMVLDLPAGLQLAGGRLYLSVGAPVLLRVDESTNGLVQPDVANPGDPNQDLLYDWVEMALDDLGFHGNTTCVDQFCLPLTLTVTDRNDPAHPLGPVGVQETRAQLFAAFRAEVSPAFRSLADAQDRRILAPGHGAFRPGGAQSGFLDAYIAAMWSKYQAEPLFLTPEEGDFTGRVDADGGLRFTRSGGDPATYLIARRPTTTEVLLCNGVLAEGNPVEKVLGAQVAALLNRHLLQRPQAWRDPAAYYLCDPCNEYARFWHRHSLGGKAYGFAYDDVANQSALLETANPQEVLVSLRWD